MSKRNQSIMISVRVGNDDAKEVRIAPVLETGNRRHGFVQWTITREGRPQVQQNRFPGSMELNAVPTDLMCSSMNAKFHYRYPRLSNLTGFMPFNAEITVAPFG